MVTNNLDDIKKQVEVLSSYVLKRGNQILAGKAVIYNSDTFVAPVSDTFNLISNDNLLKLVSQILPNKPKWIWAYYRKDYTLFHIYGRISDNMLIEVTNSYSGNRAVRVNFVLSYPPAIPFYITPIEAISDIRGTPIYHPIDTTNILGKLKLTPSATVVARKIPPSILNEVVNLKAVEATPLTAFDDLYQLYVICNLWMSKAFESARLAMMAQICVYQDIFRRKNV